MNFLFNNTFLLTSALDVENGLNAALTPAKDFIWRILCNYVSPIGVVILIGILAFKLVGTGLSADKLHQIWTEQTMQIILLLVLIFITGSLSVWGQFML